MTVALGIDLGGTKIEHSVVDSKGVILNSHRIATPDSYDDLKRYLLELFDFTSGNHPDLCGVGLSIPGSIDPKTGLLRNAPNSPAINGTDFFMCLKLETKLPLYIENDANCLALSEYNFGVARNMQNFVALIMGTGFGSGVFLEGMPFKSSQDLAPELGHSLLDYKGRLCLCGNRGCVEAYLSGPSILARYQEAGGQIAKTTEEIFDSTKHHDPIAATIIEQTKEMFIRFIASLVSIYDPQIIVLGGGLSNQTLYYGLETEIASFVFGSDHAPKILKAKHGDASGKLGAASLCFTE